MYQFFLCKSNIIEWKVKPKIILFKPFFKENARISLMAASALLYTLLRYTPCSFLSGLFYRVKCLWQHQTKRLNLLKAEATKYGVESLKSII